MWTVINVYIGLIRWRHGVASLLRGAPAHLHPGAVLPGGHHRLVGEPLDQRQATPALTVALIRCAPRAVVGHGDLDPGSAEDRVHVENTASAAVSVLYGVGHRLVGGQRQRFDDPVFEPCGAGPFVHFVAQHRQIPGGCAHAMAAEVVAFLGNWLRLAWSACHRCVLTVRAEFPLPG